tara:strand:- start:49 stop:1446 length:1398 start_codon:yes stop_codon:yes gene_type:complete
MSLVTAINAETTPLNGASQFSSSQGQFNIVFEISGGANQMIDLNSIRMLSDIDFLKSNGQHFNNMNIYSNNLIVAGAGVAQGGVLPAYTTATNPYYDIDARTGISNCINTVLFQDAESNVLEAVYSYPHLMNKVGPMSLSKDDQLTWTSHIYGIKSGGRSLQNQYALNSSLSCAIKLYTGLTQSKPIPFAAIRGKLKIVVTLNAPASALFGGENTGARMGIGGAGNEASGSYFNMNNVRLVYRTIVLDENAPVLGQGYGYKHFSSLQSTINNSNNQNIYNPNSTNAISVLTSFIKSDNLNSYAANSVKSDKLQNVGGVDTEIFQTNFLKNNIRFPNAFPIDSREFNENNDAMVAYDAQRSYYFMSCLTPLSKLNNTLIQASTETSGTLRCGAFTQWQQPDNTPVYGVGIRYANVSGADGTNFTGGQNFLQRIQSGLNGSQPNEMFSNVLSTKRIVPTASGPLVMQ